MNQRLIPSKGKNSPRHASAQCHTRLTESLAEAALGSSKARVDGAEQLTRIINRYFQRMIDVIRRHGGDVVKFAGDAMLVLFRCEKARLREAGTPFKDARRLTVGSVLAWDDDDDE